MTVDEALFRAINGLAGRTSVLDVLMVALGHPSNFLVPAMLAVGYWLWRRAREAVLGTVALSVMIVAADAAGAQVKWLVQRPRPCRLFEHVTQVVGCGGTYSFPSNHAMNTAAAAAFLHVLYPVTGWFMWPLVVLVGFSRVYVGAHFVTDVVGAWMLGIAMGATVGWLLIRLPMFRPRSLSE